jgi:hypothetical protein
MPRDSAPCGIPHGKEGVSGSSRSWASQETACNLAVFALSRRLLFLPAARRCDLLVTCSDLLAAAIRALAVRRSAIRSVLLLHLWWRETRRLFLLPSGSFRNSGPFCCGAASELLNPNPSAPRVDVASRVPINLLFVKWHSSPLSNRKTKRTGPSVALPNEMSLRTPGWSRDILTHGQSRKCRSGKRGPH